MGLVFVSRLILGFQGDNLRMFLFFMLLYKNINIVLSYTRTNTIFEVRQSDDHPI